MKCNILGIQIDNISLNDALRSIGGFFTDNRQHYLVTTNPEFIMAARHDEEFRSIINRADLSVADGMGIKIAARRFGWGLKQRITGVDLIWEIAKLAEQNNASIFLLGAKHGIAEQTAVRLIEKYPNLKIAGAESGYRGWHRHLDDHKLIDIINRRQPDILFVAFGQVKQEKWIYHNLPKMPSVKLAMGVGGSFDYISGKVRRAPAWMRQLGLEWLFRLIWQPWRLPRIVTAVVRFSWAVLFSRKNEA